MAVHHFSWIRGPDGQRRTEFRGFPSPLISKVIGRNAPSKVLFSGAASRALEPPAGRRLEPRPTQCAAILDKPATD